MRPSTSDPVNDGARPRPHLDPTVVIRGASEVRGGTIKISGQRKPPLVIGRDPVTIGRDAGCALVIDDPKVSAMHLEIVATQDGARVRDLDSRNGTWLAGARLRDAVLVEPARLRVGDVTLVFAPTESEKIRLPRSLGAVGLVGSSAPMRRVFDVLSRAAPTELSVLLLGETGTGKDVAARAIHKLSKRADGPFVVVDCGSIPSSLAEATLFGHERGAYTGAVSARRSPFLDANGGTIFLDEIGELPLEAQPKLLRALAEQRVQSVGGRGYKPFDARVIAATRQNLAHAVNSGGFRSDLYFRLAHLSVELPSLRQRLDDIPALTAATLESAGDASAIERVTPETLERMMSHDWPGNVRELRSAVTAAFAMSDGGDIDVMAFVHDGSSAGDASTSQSFGDARTLAMARFERAYFTAMIRAVGMNVSEIARRAGMDRAYTRRILRTHELIPARSSGSGSDEPT
jgi:DNA-binding NtrC family response regulator